jgi:hypothetical protein
MSIAKIKRANVEALGDVESASVRYKILLSANVLQNKFKALNRYFLEMYVYVSTSMYMSMSLEHILVNVRVNVHVHVHAHVHVHVNAT